MQLGLSGTIPFGTVLPAMLGVHALIGIGEAVITVAALSAVLATRPDLIGLGRFAPAPPAEPPPRTGPGGRSAVMKASTRVFIVVALALAVGLSTAVSPFASSSPDGLEKVAEEKGFIDAGTLHAVQEDSPIPDYAFPGVENERVATGLAGFVGTLAVFAIGYGIAWALRRRGDPGPRPLRRAPQPAPEATAPARWERSATTRWS